MRRCIATQEDRKKVEMYRFVLDPSGVVTPDVSERLPGRGIWVTATRTALQKAIDKNLFARAAKAPATVPDGLLDMIERLSVTRTLDMISLCRKSGRAVVGFDNTKTALITEKAKALIQASDGSDGQKQKLRPPKGHNDYISCLTATELGLAFGREHVIHAALMPGGLTKRALTEAARLSGLRGNTAETKTKKAG